MDEERTDKFSIQSINVKYGFTSLNNDTSGSLPMSPSTLIPLNGNNVKKYSSTTMTGTKPLGLQHKAIFTQVWITIVANLACLTPGMGFSFPAITFDSLTNQSNPMALSKEQASWYASIFAIAMPLGCILSSYILDSIGRKLTLAVINLFSIGSWFIMIISSQTDPNLLYIELLCARFLLGIAAGLAASPGSVYCAEVVHEQIRGKVIVITTVVIASGMLTSYVWGYFLPDNWRMTSLFGLAFSVVAMLLLLILVPETPSWLASHGRLSNAEHSLRLFRGLKRRSFINSELRLDIERLRQQCDRSQTQHNESVWLKFRRPEVYKPFIIMLVFFLFQQFSGIFVIIMYAVQFSKAADVAIDPFLCSVMIGICRVVTTVGIGYMMDKVGRRGPAMFSGATMAACMFGIAAYVHYEMTTFAWIPVLLLVGYIFFSTLGLLTLPFTMNPELFPQDIRGFAAGLTASFSFLLCFLMVKSYPAVSLAMGNVFIFMLFGTVSLSSVLFTYYFLPETAGKSLEQIKNLFIKRVEPTESGPESKSLMS